MSEIGIFCELTGVTIFPLVYWSRLAALLRKDNHEPSLLQEDWFDRGRNRSVYCAGGNYGGADVDELTGLYHPGLPAAWARRRPSAFSMYTLLEGSAR